MSNHSASTNSAREWDAAKEYMVARSPWVHNLQYRIFKLREEAVQAKKNNEHYGTKLCKIHRAFAV